jgi:hypothetical protein
LIQHTRLRKAHKAAHMGKTRNVNKILVENLKETDQLKV